MKLPELDKPFLTIRELSERWDGVSEQKIISYGLTGQLKFSIADGKWNNSDRALNMYPNDKGAKPYQPLGISREQLELILHSKVNLRLKDVFPNVTSSVEIENSKNRYVTADCLCVTIKDILSFETSADSHKPTKQTERETALARLIREEGIENLTQLGRIGVWNKLHGLDRVLFPARASAKDSTLRKFFTDQKLIEFPLGRKKG